MAITKYTRLISLIGIALLATISPPALSAPPIPNDIPEAEPWKEAKYVLPAYPGDDDLLEFYVSETATAKFFIDPKSITSDSSDGVVRYTLVIKTPGGAINVNYEALRCIESEYKLYATGRSDKTWSENPNPTWRGIKRFSLNSYQAALARNYFCPNYVPIFTAEEGRNALKRGAHPSAPGQNK